MKTPDDQLLARWLDGELSAEDSARFEAMMAADPQLRKEAEEMRQISLALREHVQFEREVPHADFFNSQIQERIGELQRADDRAKAATTGGLSSLFSWLRTPWVLAGATAAVAIALLVFRQERPSSQVLSFYAPNPNIQATAYHSTQADATVLMLDGLESIPAERDVAGVNAHHSESDLEMASTYLYDDHGDLLLVMTKNTRNLPVFVASR